MSEVSFDQAIDAVSQLPYEQQMMLVEIVRRRLIEARRQEMAGDAQASIRAFRAGRLPPQSAEEAIAELHQGLEETEE